MVAKDGDSVAVIGSGLLGEGTTIYHIHFDGPYGSTHPLYYWVSLGAFREYFRRVSYERSVR